MLKPAHWSYFMGKDAIVPEDEGPTEQMSLRIPRKLLARWKAISKDTEQNLAAAMIHGLRWAATEYEAQREKERQEKRV